MNIGIDIRVLARGARTGVEEYTINLLSRLLLRETKINYQLFYNAFRKAELNYPWLFLDKVSFKRFRIPNRLFFLSARYFNQPKIDKLLGKIDVYFNPHFFPAPLSANCRKIVTFHDLSFLRYPEFFSWRKRIWQRFLVAAQKEAVQADKIIAVSQSTRQDLINLYGIKPDKIKVIHSGIGEKFKNLKSGSWSLAIKRKYNLPKKFILYFGTIEPRKNLVGLIKAFELLGTKHKLVFAGTKGWLYQDILKTARESKRRKDIFFTGFVEDEDKPQLYNLADLFIYPSFFEGFGFPPLEAMACGVPTVVSHASSLPEVVGQGALMIDPHNIDEMAWALETILTDESLRKSLVEKGFVQAKKFSWSKCARETLEVIKKAAG